MNQEFGKDFRTKKLMIEGALEFSSLRRIDNRGQFARHYSRDMAGPGTDFQIAQANISRTTEKFTFRGMHYQIPPCSETKLISCISGRVLDVIVDLRFGSSTYLQWEIVELSEEQGNLLYVPVGVANGYLSLDDNTVIHYYSSAAYSNSHERGFRYDDRLVSIDLPIQPVVVSPKDLSWRDLVETDLHVFKM